MRVRGWVSVAALALVVLIVPATNPASAAVIVGVAPPPVRVEVVPRARVGYIWTPGYWRWNGHHHVWVGGYWLPARPGWRGLQRTGHRMAHAGATTRVTGRTE
jgi:hypothetical protein